MFGEGGASYFDHLVPMTNYEVLQEKLVEVEEYLSCIRDDATIPISEYASIQPILRYLKVPNYVLDSAQCWAISSCILMIDELQYLYFYRH